MSLDPLLSADLAIQFHAFSAIAAFLLGAVVLWSRKGTALHKALGKIWVALMLIVATSALFITEIRLIGPFSLIHIFSILTYAGIAHGLYEIRRGNVPAHRAAMQGVYLGSLILAGTFTFLLGRRMHETLFGPEAGWRPRSSSSVSASPAPHSPIGASIALAKPPEPFPACVVFIELSPCRRDELSILSSFPGPPLHQAGLRVATSLAESAVNSLVAKRMVKKQQMRWSQHGAHMLMQVRTAEMNGELRDRLRASFLLPEPHVPSLLKAKTAAPSRITPKKLPVSRRLRVTHTTSRQRVKAAEPESEQGAVPHPAE